MALFVSRFWHAGSPFAARILEVAHTAGYLRFQAQRFPPYPRKSIVRKNVATGAGEALLANADKM